MKKLVLPLLITLSIGSNLWADVIDGPANLRDKPGGKLLISLNDNVTVERLEVTGDWYRVAVNAFVDNAALIGSGRLGNSAVLRDRDGNAIGRTLTVVEIEEAGAIVPGQRTVPVRIVASTHKRNIRRSTPKTSAVETRVARGVDGKTSSATPPPLTKEEEKLVERIGISATVTPNAFRSEDEAIRYLKILLKRDHRTINLFSGYDDETEDRKVGYYGQSIEGALAAITTKAKSEGVPLAIEVVRTRKEYPYALAEAAVILRAAGDNSVVPYLYELTGHPETRIRRKAAESLLALGDIDAALPVLDRLTEQGVTAALGDVYWGMQGKTWEKRGLELVRKALTYENKESLALAALFLIRLTKQGIAKEDLGKMENFELNILRDILKQKKLVDVVKETAMESRTIYSDYRAIEFVISAVVELNSKQAIPLLKQLTERGDVSYLKRRADDAIKQLELSGRDK